jgi:hypothetical protein
MDNHNFTPHTPSADQVLVDRFRVIRTGKTGHRIARDEIACMDLVIAGMRLEASLFARRFP